MSKVRWSGLDVHAETIGLAVAEPTGEARCLGMIPNRPESTRKLVTWLGPVVAEGLVLESLRPGALGTPRGPRGRVL
jgi:hypothetical protein